MLKELASFSDGTEVTEGGFQPTASQQLRPLKELDPTNSHLSLEADPRLVELSDETPAQANNWSAAL